MWASNPPNNYKFGSKVKLGPHQKCHISSYHNKRFRLYRPSPFQLSQNSVLLIFIKGPSKKQKRKQDHNFQGK